ncbi:MAG: hypothetical protein KKD39_05020 [Candidatus Altiarchaeota archaeon]|nr:hypothetical protein [Candidatus Altiarchaeota archaeon]
MIKRRGLAGISALILMVAVLISAFVIGYSLYTATQTLLRQQEAVSEQKEKSLQRPVIVEHLRAQDLDADKRVDVLVAVIRLRGGDNPINLNDTIVLTQTSAINCSALTYGLDSKPGCRYEIAYAKTGKRWYQDHLSDGDLIEMRYSDTQLRKGVEDLSSRMVFVPPEGLSTQVNFEMPARIYPPNIYLWPVGDQT